VIGDDLVPAGVVGLDENGTVIGTAEVEAVMPVNGLRSGGQRRARQGRC